MLTLSGLQAKLLEYGVVMPLPWTELATRSFCCGSCVGSELPLDNQPESTKGYVWFCEQSLDAMPDLFLSWSAVGDFTHEKQVAFGYELFWIFSQLELSPEWDGNTGNKIVVTMLNYTEFEEWFEAEHGDDDDDDTEWMEGDDDDEDLDRW